MARQYKPRYHRDGTVTYWSVYDAVWHRRAEWIPDHELAAMSSSERERVLRHLAARGGNGDEA